MTHQQYAHQLRAQLAGVPATVLRAAEQTRAYVEGRIKYRLSGAVLRRQTGDLRQSLVSDAGLTPSGAVVRWRVGEGLRYARIHEEGGTVLGRPWLRIPLTRGKQDRVPSDVLVFRGGGGYIWRRKRDRSDLIALLRRSVRIPARPYMAPSVAEGVPFASKALADGMRRLLKGR